MLSRVSGSRGRLWTLHIVCACPGGRMQAQPVSLCPSLPHTASRCAHIRWSQSSQTAQAPSESVHLSCPGGHEGLKSHSGLPERGTLGASSEAVQFCTNDVRGTELMMGTGSSRLPSHNPTLLPRRLRTHFKPTRCQFPDGGCRPQRASET